MYGVQEHKGFLLLTGEVGTGKTTLLQPLLTPARQHTAVAFVFNSTLPFEGSSSTSSRTSGSPRPGSLRAQRLVALHNFLIERRRAGQNTVVIFDEAQNLQPATLEQIRLLSNFETTTEKLVQILLVGQPELKTKLNLPELRQLKQRVGLRCAIPPLRPEEIHDYIRRRLRIAGGQDLNLFADRAVGRIADYSKGIPRVINIICDHCLLIGYADQQRRIDQEIVERAIKYLEEGELPSARARQRGSQQLKALRWAVGAAVACAVGGLVALALQEGSIHQALTAFTHGWWAR